MKYLITFLFTLSLSFSSYAIEEQDKQTQMLEACSVVEQFTALVFDLRYDGLTRRQIQELIINGGSTIDETITIILNKVYSEPLYMSSDYKNHSRQEVLEYMYDLCLKTFK